MIKLNGFELSQNNNFYITNIDVRTNKNIDKTPFKNKHGIQSSLNSYFNQLIITISGSTNIHPYYKNILLYKINFGLIKIEFDDGYYLGELQNVVFEETSDIPNMQLFSFVFFCPTPFKYKTEKKTIKKIIYNETKVFHYDDNILLPLTDVNFYFPENVNIYLKSYRIRSNKNDDGYSDLANNENSLNYFDEQNNAIVAEFFYNTYVSKLMLHFDEIGSSLRKSNIEIWYKKYSETQFTKLETDYTIDDLDAKSYGMSGYLYLINDINVEAQKIKIRYIGNDYQQCSYLTDVSKKNLAIIIPEYFSWVYGANGENIFINGQDGLICGNTQVGNFCKGQFLRLFPIITYAYADTTCTLICEYQDYNLYEVENV